MILGHRRLHESRAGARPERRQAHRHLGVRLRALRDADRAPAFAGETISDTIARILEREPDWSALPRQLLRASTAVASLPRKDPKQRLQDIGDVSDRARRIDDDRPMSVCAEAGGRAPAHEPARMAALGRGRQRSSPGIAVRGSDAAASQRSTTRSANAQFTRFTDWEGTEEARRDLARRQVRGVPVRSRSGDSTCGSARWAPGSFSNLTADIPPLAPEGSIASRNSASLATAPRSGSIPETASR